MRTRIETYNDVCVWFSDLRCIVHAYGTRYTKLYPYMHVFLYLMIALRPTPWRQGWEVLCIFWSLLLLTSHTIRTCRERALRNSSENLFGAPQQHIRHNITSTLTSFVAASARGRNEKHLSDCPHQSPTLRHKQDGKEEEGEVERPKATVVECSDVCNTTRLKQHTRK